MSLQHLVNRSFTYDSLLNRSNHGNDMKEKTAAAETCAHIRSGFGLSPEQTSLLMGMPRDLWGDAQDLIRNRYRSADSNQKVAVHTEPRRGLYHLYDTFKLYLSDDPTCFDGFLEKNSELLNTHKKQFVMPSVHKLGFSVWSRLQQSTRNRWHLIYESSAESDDSSLVSRLDSLITDSFADYEAWKATLNKKSRFDTSQTTKTDPTESDSEVGTQPVKTV